MYYSSLIFFLNLSYLTNGNEDDNDDDDELIFI